MRARRALRVALLVLVALIGAAALVAFEKRTELRVRWLVSRTAHADEKRLGEIAAELAAIGSPGLAALEGLAFSEKVAERGTHETLVRQVALDELIRTEIKLANRDEMPDALAPFVGRALGLERDIVSLCLVELTLYRRGSERLDAAVACAVVNDPHEVFGSVCCDHLHMRRARSSERLRAAQIARSAAVRYRAFRSLIDEHDPCVPELIAAAAHDPDELLRVAAMRLRWERGDRSVYSELAHALRKNKSAAVQAEALHVNAIARDLRFFPAFRRIAGDASSSDARDAARLTVNLVLRARIPLPPELDVERDAPVEPPPEPAIWDRVEMDRGD